MSTTPAQRIGIWLIVIILGIGSVTTFAAVIFMNKNDQTAATQLATACTEYRTSLENQTAELSARYYPVLQEFSGRVAAFDKESVTELKSEDLKIGEGQEITAESKYSAYYIGWNPSGKIFDQSITGNTLRAPLSATPGGLITGWEQGVVGMKVGGIREITIPSDLAYGEQDRSADIPPNTPLKFIVMVIETPTPPTVPAALKEYEQYLPDGLSYVCQ